MNNRSKTQKLVLMALLIALSYIGGMIKIFGSVALDAMPAYFAALLLGGPIGAAVGAIGHLFSALLAGFPLSMPMHALITLCMAAACWFYGYLYKKTNIFLASIVAILINGPVMTYASAVMAKALGVAPSVMAFFTPMIVPLIIASTVNVVLAAIVYLALSKTLFKNEVE